jgi:hypothetical protein
MDLPTLLTELSRGGVSAARRAPNPYLVEASDTRIQPHQFRDVQIEDGPFQIEKFRAKRWTFRVRGGSRTRLTFHHYDTDSYKKRILNELEFFFNQLYNNVLMMVLFSLILFIFTWTVMEWIFDFFFNPTGPHAVTIQKVLTPTGLDFVLEQFARMIQSGKDIYLDDKTQTYHSVLSLLHQVVIGRMASQTKMDFINKSLSIIKINNEW